MTLPLSGAIALSQVKTELGASGTLNMGHTDVRSMASKPSGVLSMSDLYGKVKPAPLGLTLKQDVLPLLETSMLRGITLVNGVYYACLNRHSGFSVGARGIVKSNDLLNWTYDTVFNTAMTAANVHSIASVGNNVVAVACYQGLSYAQSSDNGVTWTMRNFTTPMTYARRVVSDGTTFVAVGQASGTTTCRTSTDGITWTTRASFATAINNSSDITHLSWTGSLFVAATLTGTVATSPDGITWTAKTSVGQQLNGGIDTTSSRWVAACFGNVVKYSDNQGTTWTTATQFATVVTSSAATWVAYTGSNYLVWMQNGEYATSPDGITWTNRGSAFAQTARYRYVVSTFVSGGVVYATLGGGRIIKSTDHGLTWVDHTRVALSSNANSSNNAFAAYAGSGSTMLLKLTYQTNLLSEDGGNTWLDYGASAYSISNGQQGFPYDGTDNLEAPTVAYGAGKFVAVNKYSTDGKVWTTITNVGTVYNKEANVFFVGTKFWSVWKDSTNGVVAKSSTDGITWTDVSAINAAQSTGGADLWAAEPHGTTKFVIISVNKTTIHDATTGALVATATSNPGNVSFASNGTLFVYSGGSVSRYSTTDLVPTASTGGNFFTGGTISVSSPVQGYDGMVYGNGKFVVQSASGPIRLATSTDGITWTETVTTFTNFYKLLASINDALIAVDPDGKLYM